MTTSGNSQAEVAFRQALDRPGTIIIMLINVGIWFYLWNFRIDVRRFAYNYDLVVESKQWWRTITASLSHTAIMHIGFNMLSMWTLGPLEQMLGTMVYLKVSFLLLVGSMAVVVGINYLMIHKMGREQTRHAFALGYSCVVFGLMTVAAQQTATRRLSFFGLVELPMSVAPFGSLLFTQLIIPNASFVGHLAGIIIGYLISFGVFGWIDTYLFLCAFSWVFIGAIGNAMMTTDWRPPGVKMLALEDRRERGGRRRAARGGGAGHVLGGPRARVVDGMVVIDIGDGVPAAANSEGAGNVGRSDGDEVANGGGGGGVEQPSPLPPARSADAAQAPRLAPPPSSQD